MERAAGAPGTQVVAQRTPDSGLPQPKGKEQEQEQEQEKERRAALTAEARKRNLREERQEKAAAQQRQIALLGQEMRARHRFQQREKAEKEFSAMFGRQSPEAMEYELLQQLAEQQVCRIII